VLIGLLAITPGVVRCCLDPCSSLIGWYCCGFETQRQLNLDSLASPIVVSSWNSATEDRSTEAQICVFVPGFEMLRSAHNSRNGLADFHDSLTALPLRFRLVRLLVACVSLSSLTVALQRPPLFIHSFLSTSTFLDLFFCLLEASIAPLNCIRH